MNWHCFGRLPPFLNYMMIQLVFYPPPPSFEAVYCYICCRRRVVVARYWMICLVLHTYVVHDLTRSLIDFVTQRMGEFIIWGLIIIPMTLYICLWTNLSFKWRLSPWLFSATALKCRRAIAIPLAWRSASASASTCKMLEQMFKSCNFNLSVFSIAF